MSYTQQTWANGISGNTPLSADRMNHIEAGVAANDITVNGFTVPLATKTTGTYVVLSTDQIILSNGAATITLPSAVAAGNGRFYHIKNIHASAAVTVNSTSGNVDGSASQSVAAGVGHAYASNGTNWFSLS